jgi:hypothetical protein
MTRSFCAEDLQETATVLQYYIRIIGVHSWNKSRPL